MKVSTLSRALSYEISRSSISIMLHFASDIRAHLPNQLILRSGGDRGHLRTTNRPRLSIGLSQSGALGHSQI